MEQEKLNLKTARWLLDGARAFMENDTLERWPDAQGLTREELFFVIRDITKVGSDEGAVEALGKIVDEDISTTVPPKLNELVQDLEQHEETTQQSDEAVEEKIRKLRAFINDQRYQQQRATESNIYVAPASPDASQGAPKEEQQTPQQPAQATSQQVPSAEEPTTTPAQIPQTPQVTPPSEPVVDDQFTYRRPLPPRPAAAPPSPKVTEGSTKPSVVERIAGQIPPTETRITRTTPTTGGGTPPITSSRPVTPGYVMPAAEQATKAVFVVKKSVAQPLLRRISNVPTRFLRNVIAVGQEAVGQGPDATQKAYAAKLFSQGVSSKSLLEAIEEYRQASPGERGVIEALKQQADVLAQHEAQRPFLTHVTQSLYPARYNQLVLANQPAAPEKGVSIENFRAVVNLEGNQIEKFDFFKFEPEEVTSTPQKAASAVKTELKETLVSQRRDLTSRTSIGISRFPGYVARIFGGSGVGASGTTLQERIALAKANRPRFGMPRRRLGGISKISPGVIALVILIPVVLLFFTGFSGKRYQGSFLGAEVEQSLFIDVTKTTPKTTFASENDLPDELTYTITVRAKQGKLINVVIDDQYTVSGEGNASIPSRRWSVPEIETEWKQTYIEPIADKKAGLHNSLLINIITVSADIENQPKQTKNTSAVIIIGNPPQDCPAGWPTPSGGRISQGPDGTATHNVAGQTEAIDIDMPTGTTVFATHRGTAYLYNDRYGGEDIFIVGTCNGAIFESWYVHLSARNIQSGQQVGRGTLLGAVGQTGFANHPHLHYMFTKGLRMEPPYIPTAIPRRCVGNCGGT